MRMLTKFKLYSCNIYFKCISYCRCLGDRDGLILRFLLTSILAARDLLKPKRTGIYLGCYTISSLQATTLITSPIIVYSLVLYSLVDISMAFESV